jgi:phosphatidylserine decarboxylase
VVAPADGRVVHIQQIEEDGYLKQSAYRVSIFLSIFNVHINYAPVTGVIDYMYYRKGSFKNAMNNVASMINENNTIGIKSEGTVMAVRQIAGVIARRIVCRCAVGDRVNAGDKIGMIKFGSRVDLFLPLSTRILVKKGDRVKGGETVLARVS